MVDGPEPGAAPSNKNPLPLPMKLTVGGIDQYQNYQLRCGLEAFWMTETLQYQFENGVVSCGDLTPTWSAYVACKNQIHVHLSWWPDPAWCIPGHLAGYAKTENRRCCNICFSNGGWCSVFQMLWELCFWMKCNETKTLTECMYTLAAVLVTSVTKRHENLVFKLSNFLAARLKLNCSIVTT